MKITFEGPNLTDIIRQMVNLLSDTSSSKPAPSSPPVEKPVEKSVFKPVDNLGAPLVDKYAEKPKRERTEKQKANDEKLRAAALERIANKRAAKVGVAPADPKAYADALRNDLNRAPIEAKKAVEKQVEAPEPELFADPAEAVKIRQKTIADLQEAYANGHQQEVFELLSRFGNGAKSFRELPPEAFMPIRDAIDKGALT